MYEILNNLPPEARVLDLGSRDGSFPAEWYQFQTVRVDLERPGNSNVLFAQADAEHLPFRSGSFDVVILNHSLEHFPHLKPSLQEIGRVVRRNGSAFVAVPDSTTFTDHLYRRIFRDQGGHVNHFHCGPELQEMLSWYLGMQPAGARTLCSSLLFFNRRNTRGLVFRREMVWRGVWEPVLVGVVALTRLIDRRFRTRTAVYGWAFYFGVVGEPVDPRPAVNVCVRCGTGDRSESLLQKGIVNRRFGVRYYRCSVCSARNVFFNDDHYAW